MPKQTPSNNFVWLDEKNQKFQLISQRQRWLQFNSPSCRAADDSVHSNQSAESSEQNFVHVMFHELSWKALLTSKHTPIYFNQSHVPVLKWKEKNLQGRSPRGTIYRQTCKCVFSQFPANPFKTQKIKALTDIYNSNQVKCS